MKDLVIIGSGPAGLSAAIYAKRAMMDVVVLEKEAYSGGQIVNTEQVDNYLGLPGVSGFEMGMKFREHADALGVPFENKKAIEIRNEGISKKILLEDGSELETRAVLIATGARHRKLGVPGEETFAGAGVSYCATCDGAFFRNKEVAVVGGGNIALEDALYLANVCSKVHLIHRRDAFRGEKILQSQVLDSKKIEFHPYKIVTKIGGEPGNLELELAGAPGCTDKSDMKTDKLEMLNVSGVFVAIGTEPVTEMFNDLVLLDDSGYVVAGEDCTTNVPGIFVAGDVRTKPVRQVATAVGDGASVIASVERYITASQCIV